MEHRNESRIDTGVIAILSLVVMVLGMILSLRTLKLKGTVAVILLMWADNLSQEITRRERDAKKK